MRLTKTARQEILDSVLNATTYEEERSIIIQAASKKIHKWITDQLKDFHAATKTLPKEWFPHKSDLYLPGGPSHLLDLTPFCKTCNITIEPISFPYPNPPDMKREEWLKFLDKEIQQANTLLEKRQALTGEMRAFLNSVTTTEKLVQRMPELERHLPSQAKVYPLVASTKGLQKALKNTGFDTGVKP